MYVIPLSEQLVRPATEFGFGYLGAIFNVRCLMIKHEVDICNHAVSAINIWSWYMGYLYPLKTDFIYI